MPAVLRSAGWAAHEVDHRKRDSRYRSRWSSRSEETSRILRNRGRLPASPLAPGPRRPLTWDRDRTGNSTGNPNDSGTRPGSATGPIGVSPVRALPKVPRREVDPGSAGLVADVAPCHCRRSTRTTPPRWCAAAIVSAASWLARCSTRNGRHLPHQRSGVDHLEQRRVRASHACECLGPVDVLRGLRLVAADPSVVRPGTSAWVTRSCHAYVVASGASHAIGRARERPSVDKQRELIIHHDVDARFDDRVAYTASSGSSSISSIARSVSAPEFTRTASSASRSRSARTGSVPSR